MTMLTKATLLTTCALFLTAQIGKAYTISVPAGYSLIANQSANANKMGLIATPATDSDSILLYNAAAQVFQDEYSYIDGYGWFSPSNDDPDGPPILPGSGAVYRTPYAHTLTISGGPLPIPAAVVVPAAWSLFSLQAATVCNFNAFLGFLPGTKLHRLKVGGDALDLFDPADYDIYTYTGSGWSPLNPSANVGEAVWLNSPSAVNVTSTTQLPLFISNLPGLSNAQKNQLLAKLKAFNNAPSKTPACIQVNQFIVDVNSLFTSGAITSGVQAQLLAAAQALKTKWGCP